METPSSTALRWIASLRLPALPESVRTARRDVRRMLDTHHETTDTGDDTELLVSELVTNAVTAIQGATPRGEQTTPGPTPDVTVVVARDEERLWLSVSDPVPLLPAPRTADIADEGGRGLALVQALSDRWGADRTPNGKTVWCAITAPQTVSPSARLAPANG